MRKFRIRASIVWGGAAPCPPWYPPGIPLVSPLVSPREMAMGDAGEPPRGECTFALPAVQPGTAQGVVVIPFLTLSPGSPPGKPPGSPPEFLGCRSHSVLPKAQKRKNLSLRNLALQKWTLQK